MPTTYDFTTGMPGGVTVSSSPIGYAPNGSGLTSFGTTNVGRRTALGILVEPAATNYFFNALSWCSSTAATYTTNSWNRAGSTPPTATSGITDPLGGTSAYRINNTSGIGGWNYYWNGTHPNTAATVTQSVIWKFNSGAASIVIGTDNAGSSPKYALLNTSTLALTFDTTGGSITGSNVALGGGWYLFQATYVASNQAAILYFLNAGVVDIWGPQYEFGSKATSFINTGAAVGNRSAEVITFNVPASTPSIVFTFDDNSTQTITSPASGTYTIPTNLNRAQIKTILVNGGAYTVTYQVGGLPLSGKPQGTLYGRLMTAAVKAAVLTGQAIGIGKGYAISAAKGSLALTQVSTGLILKRLMTASVGALALTQKAIGLTRNYPLAVVHGSLALSAKAVGAFYGRALSIAKGSLALTQKAIGLAYSGFSSTYTLIVAKAAMALSGVSVATLWKRFLGVASGSLPLSGISVALFRGRALVVAVGALALAGKPVGFLMTRILTVTKATVALTGGFINFMRTGVVSAARGAAMLLGL